MDYIVDPWNQVHGLDSSMCHLASYGKKKKLKLTVQEFNWNTAAIYDHKLQGHEELYSVTFCFITFLSWVSGM